MIDAYNATLTSAEKSLKEENIASVDSLFLKAGLIVDYALRKPLFIRGEILGAFTIVEHRGYSKGGGADIKLGVGYRF